MLKDIGDELLPISASNVNSSGVNQNLEAYAVLKRTQAKAERIDIVVYNFQIIGGEVANFSATITLSNLPSSFAP